MATKFGVLNAKGGETAKEKISDTLQIGHGILLDPLHGMGIGNPVLQWILSHVWDRVQRGALGECFSAPWQLGNGVPQVTISSQIIFNIYLEQSLRDLGLNSAQHLNQGRAMVP